jgi:hypothetical protein
MLTVRNLTKGWRVLAIIVALSLLIVMPVQGAVPTTDQAPFHFKITLPQATADSIAALGLKVPVTGRVFVIITRDNTSEPRQQIDVLGVPLWGMDVRNFAGGSTAVMGTGQPTEIGYPLADFSQIPDGDYYVQAFLNVYSTFNRSDGKVLELHKDTGSGQNIWRAPGNAYSTPLAVHLGKGSSRMINLDLTNVIPPVDALKPGQVLEQGNPVDTQYVKYIKIKSNLVSQFWGQDMYIGANVLLPNGYNPADKTIHYPVIYVQGHFPSASAPFSFTPTNSFGKFWLGGTAPRFIAVVIRHASPFYDDSYAVNSVNSGPYGDAITQELIPYIDANFNTIAQPWARVLTGGSTGGWESAALKVWYPDLFGHTWVWYPDPVDFRYYQIVNIYKDTNAYFTSSDWEKVERPSARNVDGSPQFTVKQENNWELAMGPNNHSYGQWSVWEVTFGPVGPDGYPARIWDPITGNIDPAVAQYWKDHFDINQKLQREWATLGPKVTGQMHFAVGDADTYFLNEAVHLLEGDIAKMTNPPANFTFEYGPRQPHGWRGFSPKTPTTPVPAISYPEWLQVVSNTIVASAPTGADMSWK